MIVSGLTNNTIILVGAVNVKEEVQNEETQGANTSTGELTAAPTEEAKTGTDEETTTNTETGADTGTASKTDTNASTEAATNTETAANTSTASDTVVVEDKSTSGGDAGMGVNAGTEAGTMVDPTMQNGIPGGKDSLLTSWPFVCGVSLAVMIVSIAIGAFLARRKIKKGIEIYED